MKIKLYKDAAERYKASCMTPDRAGSFSQEYFDALKEIEGKTLDVETEFLSKDQFNTEELRIMSGSVEKVIGDIRPGRFIDRWTNENHQLIPAECCTEERRKYVYQWQRHPNFPDVIIDKKVFAD